MKFGDLKNKPVVGVADAHRLGYVETVLLDLNGLRLLGFRVRSGGLLTHRDAVLLADVKSVGDDAVTVEDASRLNAEGKFAELKNSTDIERLIGARILNETGHVLGTVADVDIDLEAATVTSYLLEGNLIDRVRRQEHVIPTSETKSIGDKLIVVGNEVTVD